MSQTIARGVLWNRDALPPGPEQDAVVKGITGEIVAEAGEIRIVRADRLAGARIENALGRRCDECGITQSHSSAPFFHS